MSDYEIDEEWSDDIYSLDQLVHHLPCIVRVSEGIYGTTDAGTFSNGDILWLEEHRYIQKVIAQEVKSPIHKTWSVDQEEILIPLGVKCIVNVVRPEKLLETTNLLSNLLHFLPRYVRVEKDFISPCGKRFSQGTQFEILRVLHGKGQKATKDLVVLYERHEISLPTSLSGRFTPLQDCQSYNFKDAVNEYTLPQYVVFNGDEIQRLATQDIDESIGNIKPFQKHGTFLLSSQISHSVVVGHMKPVPSQEKIKSDFCERSCVVLTMQNPLLSDIEFHMLHYSEPAIYERILTRNFSQSKGVSEEVFEGLYIEYKKRPRIFINPDNLRTPQRTNPPIPVPPRTYRHVDSVSQGELLL